MRFPRWKAAGSRRRYVLLASAAVLVAALGYTVATRHSPLPRVTGAVGIAPTGSDSNPCTAVKPCKSFDFAYRVARPGQVVRVQAGSYPSQTIHSDRSKTSAADVVFRAAEGARVVVGDVTVEGAAHLSFGNLSLHSWDVQPGSSDVTFRNIKAGSFRIWGPDTDSINVLGGDYGPASAPYYSKIISASGPPTHVLVDGATFHDVTSPDLNKFHAECLMIWAGVGITVRNSRFYHCAVFDLEFQLCCGSRTLRDVTVASNVFAPPTEGGYITVNFVSSATTWRNFTFRNNTFDGPVIFAQQSDTHAGSQAVGNVLRIDGAWECPRSISLRNNVFVAPDGSRCGDATNRGLAGRRGRPQLPATGGSAAIRRWLRAHAVAS